MVLVSILMFGSTYSIFTSSSVDEDANVYKTGILDITYTLSSSNITFSSIEPISDEDVSSVIPYQIVVTNNGNVPYMFDVILSDTTTLDVIDYKYIMTKVGNLESKSLADCPNNVIKEDVVVAANDSVYIDVRVWISDKVQNSEIGKSFYAKLMLDGLAVYDSSSSVFNDVLSLRYMKGFNTSNLCLDNVECISGDDYSYFRDDLYRDKIKNIYFVDYIDNSDSIISWDLSSNNDSSIKGWLNLNSDNYYDLYIGSKEKIYATDLSYFFDGLTMVESIDFSNLDTGLTKDMSNMFYNVGYNSLKFNMDVSVFNMSNVVKTTNMFMNCGYNATDFDIGDISKWDVFNVSNMEGMFHKTGYKSKFSFDYSKWNLNSEVIYDEVDNEIEDAGINSDNNLGNEANEDGLGGNL